MSKLTNADRAKIVACMVEGNSIRATVRRSRNSPHDWAPARRRLRSCSANSAQHRKHISTSFAERQNLTMRMSDAPLHTVDEWVFKEIGAARKRTGAVLHVLQFLPHSPNAALTPAVEAGVSDHVWSIEEVIALLDAPAMHG